MSVETTQHRQQVVYVEHAVRDHPRVQAIIARYTPRVEVIPCNHYGEVFNRKRQNFRVQKQHPAIILASKPGRRVLPSPPGFGIGGAHNYYFSHMLNCLYDCRYCFLQGMYRSANYVLFVNYEDFMDDIRVQAQQHEQSYYFSGYDCDSLAFDPVSGFLDTFLPFFEQVPEAVLELRTKSANVNALLKHTPFENCVVAFSLTPAQVAVAVEHKAPPTDKRLAAIRQLSAQGWQIGVRFDPLIYSDDVEAQYAALITAVAACVNPAQLHSVSIGPMRFPTNMYKTLHGLYPSDALLNHPLETRGQVVSYSPQREAEMLGVVQRLVAQHLPAATQFSCMAT